VAVPWEVVWIDPNHFRVHTIGIDRVTEWRLPSIYVRCGVD